MRHESTIVAVAALACAGSLLYAASGMAATQASSASPSTPSEDRVVKNSDTGYATPEPIHFESKPVQAQGGSLRPGPHNRHLSPPHGGLVMAGDRSQVPGRE
jgi:hypothetical protein